MASDLHRLAGTLAARYGLTVDQRADLETVLTTVRLEAEAAGRVEGLREAAGLLKANSVDELDLWIVGPKCLIHELDEKAEGKPAPVEIDHPFEVAPTGRCGHVIASIGTKEYLCGLPEHAHKASIPAGVGKEKP